MIGALRGTIIEQKADTILLDVNGVGYELTATRSALEAGTRGAELALIVFTDVKETSITLYGFRDSLEKEVFLLLKKVKGIGSKIALSIVSSIGPETLLQAIGQNDITRLKSIPGIGSKTAERVIVELRENVREFATESLAQSFSAPAGRAAPAGGAEGDVLLALEKLGFPLERARQVVAQTLRVHAEKANVLKTDPGELLRLSLGQLGERHA